MGLSSIDVEALLLFSEHDAVSQRQGPRLFLLGSAHVVGVTKFALSRGSCALLEIDTVMGPTSAQQRPRSEMISAILEANLEGIHLTLSGSTAQACHTFRSSLSAMLHKTGPPPTTYRATPPSREYYMVVAQTTSVLLPVLFDGRAVLAALRLGPGSSCKERKATYLTSAVVTYNLATTILLASESSSDAEEDRRRVSHMYKQVGRLLARVVAGGKHPDPLLALFHTCLVCNLAGCKPSSVDLVRQAFASLARQPLPDDVNEHAQRAFQRFASCVLPGTSLTFHGAGAA